MNEEQDKQASVIVDMPEMETKRTGKVRTVAIVGLVIVASAAALWFVDHKFGVLRLNEKKPETIRVIVKIDPKEALVKVDGKQVTGNPIVLDVLKDSKFHTIKAEADGYESIEKDVEFDVPKTVVLTLIEIIKPDEPRVLEPTGENPEDDGVPDVVELPDDEPEADAGFSPSQESEKVLKHKRKQAATSRPMLRTKRNRLLKSNTNSKTKNSTLNESGAPKSSASPKEKTPGGLTKTNPFG